MRSRTRWRSRLFTRLRVTAVPTVLATTNPIRRSGSLEPGQVDHQQRSAGAATTTHRRREPRGVGEALAPGQHDDVFAAGSGSQAVATLAPARGEDAAPGTGAHPQSEAVRLVTTPVVRLERTLAHEVSAHVGAGSKVVGVADRGVLCSIEQPIDAGPTAQRYAEPEARVKLTTSRPVGARPTHRDTPGEPSTADTPTSTETCGQLVDPQAGRLLRFPPPSCRSRAASPVPAP